MKWKHEIISQFTMLEQKNLDAELWCQNMKGNTEFFC